MKRKLFLIITAILAAYPCAALAETVTDDMAHTTAYDEIFSDRVISDEVYSEYDTEVNMQSDIENEVVSVGDEELFGSFEFEEDIYAAYEEAQLHGDEIPWDGMTMAEVTPVDGVYEISNGAQLAWIAERVNAGNGGMCDYTIRLISDIDLGGHMWTPIGHLYAKPFAGTFEGNSHTVSNLNFDASQYTHAGLFGCVIGTVSNVTVKTVDEGIATSRRVNPSNIGDAKTGIGIVAGTVEKRLFDYNTKEYTGCIEDCTAQGAITVNNTFGETFYTGGITGANSDAILVNNTNYANVSVTSSSTDADSAVVGGITGFNSGELYGAQYVGAELNEEAGGFIPPSITVVSSSPCVGAVTGENTGSINGVDGCADISITKTDTRLANNYINAGGIAGRSSGKIEFSQVFAFSAEINRANEGSYANIGGIAGEVSGSGIISDCSFKRGIEANAPIQRNIGGIAGNVSGINAMITDCTSDGSICVSGAEDYICTGGIAGVSYGIIDSCKPNMSIDIDTAVSASAGSVVGVSFNSVNDCTSAAYIELETSSELAPVYGGGIIGEAHGRVLRCSYNGSLSVTGALSCAGGIIGHTSISSNDMYDEDEITAIVVEKCSVGDNARISCPNVSGGIIGYAEGTNVTAADFSGTLEGSAGSGGIAGNALGLNAENCRIAGTNTSASNAGAVYSYNGGTNTLNKLYISTVLSGDAKSAVTASGSAAVSNVYLNTETSGCDAAEGITAVTNETAADRQTFAALDFGNIWAMIDNAPALQYTSYSNAVNNVGVIDELRMRFNINLENPQAGQRIYVALYDENDRFCGTVSAVCEESDINATNTRADMSLTYRYDYWTFTDPTDPSTWAPAEHLPVKAKAFTWDSETGMKSLSSVDEKILDYHFE